MNRGALLAFVVAFGTTAALYAFTASLPYFSETYQQLDRAATLTSAAASFDPEMDPYRPFQHLFFYMLAGWAEDHPPLARIPGFLLHAGSCLLVAHLVRLLGGSRRAAVASLVTFALFPNLKNLVWVAAISWPGRIFFTLLGLCLFLHHRRQRRWWSGPGFFCAFVIALLFSQGAVSLPFFFVLLLLALDGWRGAWSRRRDPWVIACFGALGIYLMFLLFFRGERVGGGGFAVLPVNVAKATFALLPEVLRVPGLDALRGNHGLVGFAVACGGWLLVVVLFGVASVRSRPIVRVLLVCIVLDFLPTISSTGFVQRYTYLGSALLACAMALASERSSRGRHRPHAAIWVVLVAAWTFDTVVDLVEIRGAGTVVARTLDSAALARQRAGDDVPIMIVDPPMFMGREQDVPVFNWGMHQALSWRGASGPWIFLRTRGHPWQMAFRLVRPAEADSLMAAHPGPVLVYSAEERTLVDAASVDLQPEEKP